MPITTAFRFALTAAALCAAVPTADARPRRVVVLDFDGPRQLADTGRSLVLAALGNQIDVVAARRWEQARAEASRTAHGPAQWAKAAKQAGVDAVIEGWIQDEGRRKILNITVREADNGREFDPIPVRIDGKTALSGESSRQFQTNLDELLEWIDSSHGDPPPPVYQPVEPRSPIGRTRAPDDDAPPPRSRSRRTPIGDDAAADPAPSRRRRPVADPDGGDQAADDQSRPAPRRSDAGADPAGGGDPEVPAVAPPHDSKKPEVSTADREVHEIEVMFPPGSEERKDVLGVKADHVPEKTPKYMIDGGLYLGSRTLVWDAPPDANVTNFAGVSTKGFQLNAAIYPFPGKQVDGILSGVGFTGSIHHSAGSTVEFDNGDEVDEFVLNQNGWELGIHYRFPLSNMVALDAGAFYGNQTFEIVDASQDFEVPDTKYSYLGAGLHLDLAITEHASVGFGARYFTVLDAGDLASTDWFGPVSASGLGLECSAIIPLPEHLYVKGLVEYQRISLETSGGGVITDDEGVTGGTDSTIRASINVGIAF
ncbi:MAG TPA: hypothetical protein VHT91_16625 [Kofleriaceae bacterium]|jgi:hypothetical protein|nr:hypothetical protein [Kofleriaceae bacterium]